jgi:hypothetical protein
MPIEEDIALAYRRYYTHHDQRSKRSTPRLAYKILHDIQLRATGNINDQRASRTSYLSEQVPGKLEIGFGSGDRLALMRSLGWTVEGVEMDSVACHLARQIHGLPVHEGTLESRGYKENSAVCSHTPEKRPKLSLHISMLQKEL